MKRILALCAIVSLLAVAPAAPGGASHASFFASGRILVPNPVILYTDVGVTDLAAPCDPASPLNGLDGAWYAIPGFDLHTAVLTPGEPTTNVAAFFYSANCTHIPTNYVMARHPMGETETGTVPRGAAYILVFLTYGAPGTFTLTIS